MELVDISDRLPGLKRSAGLHTWRVFDREMREHPEAPPQKVMIKTRLFPSMFPPPVEVARDRYHLDRAFRLMPHAQDTGGFFIALLRKTDRLPRTATVHKPHPAYPSTHDIPGWPLKWDAPLPMAGASGAGAAAAAPAAEAAVAVGGAGTDDVAAAPVATAGVKRKHPSSAAAATGGDGDAGEEAGSGSDDDDDEEAAADEAAAAAAAAAGADDEEAAAAPADDVAAAPAAAGGGGAADAASGALNRFSKTGTGGEMYAAAERVLVAPLLRFYGIRDGFEAVKGLYDDAEAAAAIGSHLPDLVNHDDLAARPGFPSHALLTRSEGNRALFLALPRIVRTCIPIAKRPNNAGGVLKVVHTGEWWSSSSAQGSGGHGRVRSLCFPPARAQPSATIIMLMIAPSSTGCRHEDLRVRPLLNGARALRVHDRPRERRLLRGGFRSCGRRSQRRRARRCRCARCERRRGCHS